MNGFIKGTLVVFFGAVGVNYILDADTEKKSDFADGCIKKSQTSETTYDYTNVCSESVSYVFCSKSVAQEMFGQGFSCREGVAAPGDFVGYAIDNGSSLLSGALSTSAIMIQACYTPTKPTINAQNPNQYFCK